MSKELSDIVQAFINLLAALMPIIIPIVLAGVGKFALTQWDLFKSNQPENIKKLIDSAVSIGADFAEKIGADRALKEYGKDKLNLALDAAHSWLELHGIDIDDTALRAALESYLFNNPNDFPSSK